MRNLKFLRSLEASAVLLFFVQAVRVLFSVLFGLIYDTIFSGTVSFGVMAIVMLFVVGAFLTPIVAPRRSQRVLLFAMAVIVALARVPLTANWPMVRLWSSILIVGASGIYIAVLLRGQARVFLSSLLLAIAADQLLRAAGHTYDVGLREWWVFVQIVLSIVTGVVAWRTFSRTSDEGPGDFQPWGVGVLDGLAVGALLFLETSLLSFPNALARWSGVNYAVVAPLLMAVTLLPLLPGVDRVRVRFLDGRLGSLGLLFLTLGGLAAGKHAGGVTALLGLLLAQFLVLVALTGAIYHRRGGGTGRALALGMLGFLVLSFALAFAFTYPYTIPAFRGMGLPVLLVAAFIACLPALRARRAESETLRPGASRSSSSQAQGGTWGLKPAIVRWLSVALVVLLTAAFAWPPALSLKEAGPIRVATYNMHYGYNTPWQLSLEAQARTIEESGADIVLLQEVDACRITSYGVDNALWLARRLGMQEVYGPALEGLSGIALLTRFPVDESGTRLLTSRLEQTAIVHARVRVDGQPLYAYGVWLGLEADERARQLDDALAYIGAASPAVFGGDFNSPPGSPTYARIQAAGFEDPFVVGGFDPAPTSPAIGPEERIDFVWMRGLDVNDARVLDSLASDHRIVVVELALP